MMDQRNSLKYNVLYIYIYKLEKVCFISIVCYVDYTVILKRTIRFSAHEMRITKRKRPHTRVSFEQLRIVRNTIQCKQGLTGIDKMETRKVCHGGCFLQIFDWSVRSLFFIPLLCFFLLSSFFLASETFKNRWHYYQPLLNKIKYRKMKRWRWVEGTYKKKNTRNRLKRTCTF